jgi:hypothetical protein
VRSPAAGAALLVLALAASRPAAQEPPEPQTGPAAPVEETPPGEPILIEEPPPPAIPQEYIDGRGYLGRGPDTWDTAQLFDETKARIFLALSDGASRSCLDSLGVAGLEDALREMELGRLVRTVDGVVRPAFPVIRGPAREEFDRTIRATADAIYPEMLPRLKKIRKTARRGKHGPWLFALAWSELFGSRRVEQILSDAGALDGRRMRDEGYLWLLIPNDPFLTGVDRYGSGRETLHHVWSQRVYPDPSLEDVGVRRLILERVRDRTPWEEGEDADALRALGILDASRKVTIPILRRGDPLLTELRNASEMYARAFLRRLRAQDLAREWGLSTDEAAAVSLAAVGFRILDRAQREGLVSRPSYLERLGAAPEETARVIVITENDAVDPLEEAYYLYDRGEFEPAVSRAETFLRNHPGDPEAIFRKGMALMRLGRREEALATFESALAGPARPGDCWRAWILIRTGNLLDLLSRRDDALERYRQALEQPVVGGSRETAHFWLENLYVE